MPLVHGLSAWAAFFGGLVFVWSYVAVSLIAQPRMVPIALNIARILVAIVVTVSLAIREYRLIDVTRLYSNTSDMIFTNSPALVKNDANGERPLRPTMPPNGVIRVFPEDPVGDLS